MAILPSFCCIFLIHTEIFKALPLENIENQITETPLSMVLLCTTHFAAQQAGIEGKLKTAGAAQADRLQHRSHAVG
jgi:hypothetical protein